MFANTKYLLRGLLAAILFATGHVTIADDHLGLPPVPVPTNNSLTPGKTVLGLSLFLDQRFSANGTVSCSSCHSPTQTYTDGKPVGVGIDGKKGTRNSPTVVNAAYYTTLFWDGRAASLEEQAKGPLVNPIEHGLANYEPILKVIRADKNYTDQFKRVFGVEPGEITIDHVAMAIASYERTVVSGDSPFDRYQYGGEKNALSPSAIEGLKVFTGKGKCAECHIIGKSDAIFTDNHFHNIGVGLKQIQGRMVIVVNAFIEAKLRGKSVDHSVLTAENISHLGRFAVTLNPADLGNFRTPGLRNIALTAPYMHDGSLKTLQEVVEFYGKGGISSSLQHPTIRNLRLTKQEEHQLVDFMESLTSSKFAKSGNIKEAARGGNSSNPKPPPSKL
jgi:cytochrome c peroxidase